MGINWLSQRSAKNASRAWLIPMQDVVLLPGITLPVMVGRPRSLAAAQAAIETKDKQIIIATANPAALERLTTDKNAEVEHLEELYPIATLAVIQRMRRLPVGPAELLVGGIERVRLTQLHSKEPGYQVAFEPLPALSAEAAIAAGADPTTLDALSDAIKSLWGEAASVNPNFPEEILAILLDNDDPAKLVYQTTILMQKSVTEAQTVLAQDNLELLLRKAVADLQKEVEVQRLRTEILGETKKEIDQQQREFFLKHQLQKIQEELGEADADRQELEDLKTQIQALPEPVAKQAKRELARLGRVGSSSAEGGVIRTYLDWLLEMPWAKTIEDNLDLQNARQVLDADHFGLAKAKDRIVEHLATFKLKRAKLKQIEDQRQDNSDQAAEAPSAFEPRQANRYSIGTVICFVGPPGVGKTSLGRSIARALGRPFERISLGGLRDDAELRGHRRTYIGAMPGRIIQALHRAGVCNPVIMLDELDKVGMDYRGDPASVLLEILDPQQNYCFRDLYLDLDFDLSKILFIGTANDLAQVPAPLIDRLEVIELSGYSEQEKLAIARRYLLPRQLEKAALPEAALYLPDETLQRLIEDYTREAGVRHLEQQLGALCRKTAVQFAEGNAQPVTIHLEQLEAMLGPKQVWHGQLRKVPKVGVATGLAWTPAGGDILFVEAVLLPQAEGLTLTGQLGDVMEESAMIARSYVWSHADIFGIDIDLLKQNGVHLHVPAGAIPKDGPSAGVTMVSAIASLLMGQPVRTDTAMTGEINLSGEVLPVGGIREKVLAANRAGIRQILLPTQNQQDLVDVPDDVRCQLEFVGCDRIEQVLDHSLLLGDVTQPQNPTVQNTLAQVDGVNIV